MSKRNVYSFLMVAVLLPMVAILLGGADVQGCTSAVVSGRVTASGRPLLWKLRDTEKLEHRLQYFSDGKYAYVGLVNADSTASTMVWGGCNSAGFAIINTAAFNTNAGDTTKFTDQEGVVMKEALMECATLADFEAFLSRRKRPWGLNANFGVIDAQGGAAYYETDNNKFEKFDVNDIHVAPRGFLVRTNYTFTGTPNVGYGFIRYATAEREMSEAQTRGVLDRSLFTERLARNLSNSMTGDDYTSSESGRLSGEMINSSDFLCRYGTASNIVVEGVKRGDDPAGSTLWTTIAFPLTCVSLPAWPSLKNVLPSCAVAQGGRELPELSRWALRGMKKIYPITRGSGQRYMDLAAFRNRIDGGIGGRVEKMERELGSRYARMVKEWRKGKPVKEDVVRFYEWLDAYLKEEYSAME